jgi:type I restriction enzyme S subunit
MREVKDSRHDYVGVIPFNWKTSKLKHVCDINKNSLKEDTPKDQIIKYIDISSIENGEVANIQEYKFKDAPSRARRIVKNGDTVISTVRTYLRAITSFKEVEENTICSTGFAVLTPKEDVISSFISYMISAENFILDVVSKSKGVSYPAISSEELSNIVCFVPPVEEQKRIAHFLDHKTSQLDSLISSKQTQINLLSEYKQSLINETVTKGLNPDVKMKNSGVEWIGEIPEHWYTSKLNQLMDVQNGFPLDSKKFNPSVGYPMIRIRDLKEQEITMFYQGDIEKDYIVKENDLLIGMDGDFNECWWKGKEALLNQRMMRIFEKKTKANRKFLFYSLPRLLKLINDQTYSTTVKHLSSVEFLNNKIAIPPLEEQKNIVKFLDHKTSQINSLITQIHDEIEKLKEYKQSIIFEAVTGKMKI